MNIVFQEQAQGLFQGSLQDSPQGILKKLARSISLLPNLHTVQIYFRPKGYYDSTTSSSNSYHSELVRDCLKGYTYPQIRNLLISPAALPFICVCPKLKVLKPYKARYLSVSDDMMDRVPELEVLGHIHMNDKILKGTSESLNCVLPPSLTRTIPSSHQKIAEFARLDHKRVTF